MKSLAETLRKALRVDEVEITLHDGKPLKQLERLALINRVMDYMQVERAKILIELKDKF